MDWVILISAGVLEAVWATALGASNGLRRLRPSIVFLAAMIVSVWGLAVAMQTIPTGTAYAVWTATGASLTVAWAMLRGTEPVTVLRMLLLLGIVGCVVGLKVVS
ncbi:multidrug efflux SMR transporter [Ornithinimicrobium ciconiae]|uniref:Multidrug efflux SMR transporter n=1 Tax=Ornithinimicrobium ciconiae TaxID=2594265 RepID=A0A516GA53_9MICO|nr:multidrug efflux SMR transporter [Ornithinimicrobium ciconiae]QDO88250.1 multidrug efflux SMR transporter [Ornithinimicrobium ciconiae]